MKPMLLCVSWAVMQVTCFAWAVQDSLASVHAVRMSEDFINVPQVISLAAVGDVMMSGGAASVINSRGIEYPFIHVLSVLQNADIATCNLEAPFTEDGTPFDKKFTFRVKPSFAGALEHAGFDVVCLANNHILDFGDGGLASTMAVLDSIGILWCGAGSNRKQAESPAFIKARGIKVAFLAYSLTYPAEFWAGPDSYGTAYPGGGRIKEHIASARDSSDFVVVQFHWGGELRTAPKPYQRWYAHMAIDAGADAVIGHHPHILQGIEVYRNKVIAYSLGNFVFGSYSRHARTSAILRLRFSGTDVLLAKVIPVSVDNYSVNFSPVILAGSQKDAVISGLNSLSAGLNTGEHLISKSGLIRTLKINHE